MTTSTRAAPSGTNSTRSNTAASCAGRSAKPTCLRRLRDDVGCLRQHDVDQRRRRLAAKPGLDRRRGAAPALRLEQEVDVEAVAAVGRDPAGRGMRLLDETSFFQRARMFRTVAEETPRPAALTSSDEATGSPDAMYSRTRAARIRLERSVGSISTRDWRLLRNYTLRPEFQVGSQCQFRN